MLGFRCKLHVMGCSLSEMAFESSWHQTRGSQEAVMNSKEAMGHQTALL